MGRVLPFPLLQNDVYVRRWELTKKEEELIKDSKELPRSFLLLNAKFTFPREEEESFLKAQKTGDFPNSLCSAFFGKECRRRKHP